LASISAKKAFASAAKSFSVGRIWSKT